MARSGFSARSPRTYEETGRRRASGFRPWCVRFWPIIQSSGTIGAQVAGIVNLHPRAGGNPILMTTLVRFFAGLVVCVSAATAGSIAYTCDSSVDNAAAGTCAYLNSQI